MFSKNVFSKPDRSMREPKENMLLSEVQLKLREGCQRLVNQNSMARINALSTDCTARLHTPRPFKARITPTPPEITTETRLTRSKVLKSMRFINNVCGTRQKALKIM